MIKEKRKNGINDCFSDCIAFMLNIHPQSVPYFAGMKNYINPTQRFFEKRKKMIRPLVFQDKFLKRGQYHMVQGISPRGNEHVVIYKGRKPFYDPNVKGGFLKKKPHTYWMIYTKEKLGIK
jgi:UDP-N-acetylmuramoylalanine-D-glutamate ligase